MKHLNIQPDEISHIVIDYDVNRFVAYVQLNNGINIAFNANYKYDDLIMNDELVKYYEAWKKPMDLSNLAAQMARDQMLKGAIK